MKNNNDQQYEIRKARQANMHAVSTDMIVNPQVVALNSVKLSQHTRRKRRINYAKKILNDDFIFNV